MFRQEFVLKHIRFFPEFVICTANPNNSRSSYLPSEVFAAVTPPSNSGTMIVDATCAPSQIKYPQDTEALNEAREITEKVIDELHVPGSGKNPRTYRKKQGNNIFT